MKKYGYTLILLFLIILTHAICCPFCPYAQVAQVREFSPYQTGGAPYTPDQFPITRIFQTEFTIQNTGPSYKNKTTLYCYIPYSNEHNQIIPRVTTTHDAQMLKDTYGNLILQFEISDISPYATEILRVNCEIQKSTKPLSAPETDANRLKAYLQPEALIECDHPRIKDLAQTLTQKDPYLSARKIFDWVANTVKYTGFDKQDKGALHGLTYKEGDCTEQAALFTALCRASHIPAKLIWGYRCPGNCHGTERLHTWSEFYADGAWYIADATNRIFDAETENYIGLVNYHSEDPNPIGHRHRYHMDFTYEDVKTRIDIQSVVRLQ